MIDQNKPYEPDPTTPVQPPGADENPSQAVVVNIPPTPPISPEPTPVPNPTVVVPANGGGVPRWFYFIFGATVIVFFLVTLLLIMQLTQKQKSEESQIIPEVSPTKAIAISPTKTQTATDAAILKLNTMDSSDEISSIEADLKNTDFTVLDQGLQTDTQMDSGL